MTQRRDFLLQAAGVAGAAMLPFASQAQQFPNKTLRIVVPNAPGGAADLTSRTIAQAISGPLGQSVIVENKPGAGGVVAGEYVARADADGHTMLLISSGTAVSEALFTKLPFDTEKDFAPVSLVATFNLALVVAENSRFKTLQEVLAYARANPGKLNIGTPQLGTTQHLAAELFKSTAGLDAQIVPFGGTPPLINALRGGQVDVGVDIVGPLIGQITGKSLRALALLGEEKEPKLPGVPLARDAGGSLAKFNATSWNGLAVPAKTPQAVIDRLNKAVNDALKQPDVQKRLADIMLHARGSTPVQARDMLVGDIRKWAGVIERAKIPKQ